jgi:hypothetical protein
MFTRGVGADSKRTVALLGSLILISIAVNASIILADRVL